MHEIYFFYKPKQSVSPEIVKGIVQEEDILSAEIRSIHSARAPDFSGMVDFKIQVSFDKKEAKRRLNHDYCSELFFPSEIDLPSFVVNHFITLEDMAGDGCATLISALPYEVFLDTVNSINASEKRIFFGALKDGVFVEQDISTES